MFRFKQFTVDDARCGMKVGTDGTLLGAWAPIPPTRKDIKGNANDSPTLRILDIGTGSGLIALMLAQRCPEARVLGIDIEAGAVEQATQNFEASPWAHRLTAELVPLQQLPCPPDEAYDLVVSNPPFFVDALKNPDAGRAAARHTDSLQFSELIAHTSRLLREGGRAAFILPAEAEQTILHLAAEKALTPIHITRVHTREKKPAKRVLITLQKISPSCAEKGLFAASICTTDTLCLMGGDGEPRSKEYATLCQDFYL